MDCPRCALINPATAERCDCGYEFRTGQVLESYLTGTIVSERQLRPERWLSVILLALLAAPALAFPLGKLVEPLATPDSQLWHWAANSQLLFFAAPLTGVLQGAVWIFAAPVRWPGRIVGLVFTVPTLFAAVAAIGFFWYVPG